MAKNSDSGNTAGASSITATGNHSGWPADTSAHTVTYPARKSEFHILHKTICVFEFKKFFKK